MLKHSLLIFYRNFKQNKGSFFINLIGFSTGLACVLLIYLWVDDELNIDKFHEKDSQLFQVMMNARRSNGGIETIKSTPGPLAKALSQEIPEVEYGVTTYVSNRSHGILSSNDKYIKARSQFAGADYFNVFSYHLLEGDKDQVLQGKNAIVISDELAFKLFNTTEHVVGKILEWNNKEFNGTYVITGIFQKPPPNSTIQFDLVFNIDLFMEKEHWATKWWNGGTNTYIILEKNANINQFNEKITNFLKSKHEDSEWSLFARKFSDNYLYGNYKNGVPVGGRIAYVRLFLIIALLILVMACINFINLSTAQASKKSKEVGIKKTIGAGRNTLIVQYMSESLLLVLLSLIIAIILLELIIPQFNNITGKQLSLDYDLHFILIVSAVSLVTGLIAGSYPAFYLSGFNPISILKGTTGTTLNRKNAIVSELWLRKTLVIFQFSISVILIVSVFVIYKQIDFIQSKNLGFKKDNVISLQREGRLNKDIEAFLQEVKNIPGVINASYFRNNITVNTTGTSGLHWPGKNEDDEIQFKYINAYYDFIETLGMEIKHGRSFFRNFNSEDQKIIFNEAAIAEMGLTDPVGKTIRLWDRNMQIIGVVKNFHFESLYEQVKPCFIKISETGKNIIIKIQAGTERETIDRLCRLYEKFNHGFPLEFRFLDDEYQVLYASETRIAVLSRYFAGMAILISCLGLLGLVAFTIQQRQKEISIRKVLGSTVIGIVYLLSKDFTGIVITALLLALPVSSLLLKQWLNSFAYKIDLEIWYFISAGFITLIIAWITIGTQAIKAATVNPAESLRGE